MHDLRDTNTVVGPKMYICLIMSPDQEIPRFSPSLFPPGVLSDLSSSVAEAPIALAPTTLTDKEDAGSKNENKLHVPLSV